MYHGCPRHLQRESLAPEWRYRRAKRMNQGLLEVPNDKHAFFLSALAPYGDISVTGGVTITCKGARVQQFSFFLLCIGHLDVFRGSSCPGAWCVQESLLPAHMFDLVRGCAAGSMARFRCTDVQ